MFLYCFPIISTIVEINQKIQFRQGKDPLHNNPIYARKRREYALYAGLRRIHAEDTAQENHRKQSEIAIQTLSS